MTQDNETLEIADLEYDVAGVQASESGERDVTEHGIIYYIPPV